MYDLHRSAIFLWGFGRFAALFSKTNILYVGFVWVSMLYSIHLKKGVNGEIPKVRAIGVIWKSAQGCFEI